MKARLILLAIMFTCLPLSGNAQADEPPVRLKLDQAEAAVGILAVQARGGVPSDTDWNRLWNSAGFRRLLERETAMGRGEGFQEKLGAWLLEPATVARHAEFATALERWRAFSASDAAARAARYLPEGIALRATLFPVIKHTTNSFVFDLANDPAIFMNVDPSDDSVYLEAVMTHELHHVGLSQCAAPADYETLDPAQQQVFDWLSLFGEGLAVLATAGDPFRHPHYYSDAGEYLAWERDVVNVGADLERMQTFFTEILDDSIPADQRRMQLFTFVATEHVPQGPAYTLGWKMAAVVERQYGHEALLAALCDPRELMRLYNRATLETAKNGGDSLPRWSEEFLARMY